MKKLFKEFAEFINKGNALALAIGVIIGASFTAIVTAINKQIISPLLGWLLGGYNLAESEALMTVLTWEEEIIDGVATGNMVPANAIYWGALIQSVIDFLLTAVILFAIFKIVTGFREAAIRAAERLQEAIQHEIKEKEMIEEIVEEVAEEVVEEIIDEPKPSEEVLLLTEIRDLLRKKNENNE